MDKLLILEPTTEAAAQFQDFLRQGMAEMDRIAASKQIKMANNQAASERTGAILATLRS